MCGLEPGQEVGAHVTTGKEEILIILEGTATVRCEEEITQVPEGHIVYIPKETDHNVQNNGDCTLKYVYVVTPL